MQAGLYQTKSPRLWVALTANAAATAPVQTNSRFDGAARKPARHQKPHTAIPRSISASPASPVSSAICR